jgi:hypothetical protein
MKINEKMINEIPDLNRCETCSKDHLLGKVIEMTHAVYPHEKIFGEFCAIQIYVDCPPDLVFDYMSDIHSLSDWTFSSSEFQKNKTPGLFEGRDALGKNTKLFAKIISNKDALTLDYHCAWDQGELLWMIYLNRIVDAKIVLNKPGSVIFWQNCKHPFYSSNPFPELAVPKRPWVGDMWDFFYAGHTLEFENLKKILEYRFKNGLKLGPYCEGN